MPLMCAVSFPLIPILEAMRDLYTIMDAGLTPVSRHMLSLSKPQDMSAMMRMSF